MFASLFKRLVRGRPAVTPAPAALEALLQRAYADERLENWAAACAAYASALAWVPGNLDLKCRFAIARARGGNSGAAATMLEEILVLDAAHLEALNALANIRKMQESWSEAEALYRRGLSLFPGNAVLHANLGLCLRAAGRIAAAKDELNRALEIMPDSPDALLNLALAHEDMGEAVEARELLQRCLTSAPEFAPAHAALAHSLLREGEFAEGWKEYAWRFRIEDAERPQDLALPKWRGEAIPDKILLVRAEQGLGDQIMLASCLPDVMVRVGLCLVECDPRLVGLFSLSFPDARVFARGEREHASWRNSGLEPDMQIHLGDLPGLFREGRAAFPRHAGYLRADPVRAEAWRLRLDALGSGKKIGISWRGGAARTRARSRSMPLALLRPLLETAGVQAISLQYGDCAGEIDEFRRTTGIEVHHWQNAIDSYEETAALVSVLDLVVSVQTALVHLSGALGKPTWVMVPAVAEWRYMARGETLAWYPSVTVFRQIEPHEWPPVIDQIRHRLG